ncbi:MAG: hypothetical protein GTN70_00655 [Deltaproteobacteria bacterium]|nr:hypothetical protein [Deltaproteobacteria bacterium]NIS76167.1 hypothetical protein [Deltaproteobacteria bacterium]
MIATPFVQGRLRGTDLSVRVRTICAHCEKELNLEIDSDLNIITPEGAEPMVFIPEVNVFTLEAPTIIDDF